jgi:hypothetical protein
MNGVEPPSTQTVVTPPIGTFDEDTGHIAVSVIDPDGQPLSGVLVGSTGPGGTEYLTTTSDGCAFFAYEDAGSYAVEVTAVGHVDGLNDPSPSQSTTVLIGATSALQFQFGDSTDLKVDYHGWNGATVPDSMPITITNSHILPAGIHTYTSGSGTPRVIQDLFPWSDGYSAFGGSCADADPIGEDGGGVPFYPGAVRDDPTDAVAGGTSNFHLDFPEVLVYVEDSTFTPLAGQNVDVVHAPDNGCPSGQSWDLGDTDSNGEVFSGLPFGTWDVYVAGTFVETITLTPAGRQTPRDVYWEAP